MDFLIEETAGNASQDAVGKPPEPWKVAVIDDVSDVHDTTRLALTGFSFQGRPLSLLHAQSAAQARELFAAHDDIAVALVDVVMETDTAGLDLVDWLRNEQGNHLARIILRTGQPGYAPETDVIARYEIDDYKEKSELNRNKLITSLTTALRGYTQLRALDRNRESLRRLITGLGGLFNERALRDFANSILLQLTSLLNVEPEGLLCAMDDFHESKTVEDIHILAAGGYMEIFSDRPIRDLPSPAVRQLIVDCIENRETVVGDCGTGVYLETPNGSRGAVFVELPKDRIDASEVADLLKLFAINASLGYENVQLFEHIASLAFIDQTTGMPSFTAYCEEFEKAQKRADHLSVLVFDIQRYRLIEEGVGEALAIEVLREVGRRLMAGFEEASVVARRQSDEFIMLFEGEFSVESLRTRMDAQFEPPVNIGDTVLTLHPRIGIARAAAERADSWQLARHARFALNDLRRRGRGYVQVFDPSMTRKAQERLKLASLLSDTENKTSMAVHYQPIVEADSGRVVSGEGLLRFHDAEGVQLHTGEAIEAAEASGLIIRIGARALKESLISHQKLLARGLDVRLNVNLSPSQVQATPIQEVFQDAFDSAGFDPRMLNVEVTENMFLDSDQSTIDKLQWLRDRGVKILIDDFGTGYSSLSYLRKLPVDGLKIDRSFVKDMVTDEDAAAVVRSIVGVGNALGLEMTAEGVETEAQCQRLQSLGVQKLQGFLFAHALPLETFEAYIMENLRTLNGAESA